MFELALDPTTWAILCGVALLAGFIDAIAGGGDGTELFVCVTGYAKKTP